jgi:putative redox protein
MATTKTARVVQLQGITFAGSANSKHWVVMDGPEEFGGSSAAAKPKELLLLGLAGCTGSDVVSILQKKRVPLTRLELNVTAEEADTYPQVYTRIHVEYVFHGAGLREQDLERAIELSETKYCSVSAMLRPAVAITHSFRIEAPASAATTALA